MAEPKNGNIWWNIWVTRTKSGAMESTAWPEIRPSKKYSYFRPESNPIKRISSSRKTKLFLNSYFHPSPKLIYCYDLNQNNAPIII